MTGRIAVVADAGDASLAGLADAGGSLVVALGAAPAGAADLRWLERPPVRGDRSAARLAAPAGNGLWRMAPWPAADALFELPAARVGRALITGGGEELRAAVVERAAARGVPLDEVERLDAHALAEAGCVILADAPQEALPARAFAVLAARRLLIVPRVRVSFGLEDGLDHVEFPDPDGAITLVEAYRRAPGLFARMLAWGRVKAEPQRASVMYARLADDLRLDGAA